MRHYLISIVIDDEHKSFTNTLSVRDSVVRGVEEALHKEFGDALKVVYIFPEYKQDQIVDEFPDIFPEPKS